MMIVPLRLVHLYKYEVKAIESRQQWGFAVHNPGLLWLSGSAIFGA